MKYVIIAFILLASIKSNGQSIELKNGFYYSVKPINYYSVKPINTCKINTVPCIMMVTDTVFRGYVPVYSIRGFMSVDSGSCWLYNGKSYRSEYFDRYKKPLGLFVFVAHEIK